MNIPSLTHAIGKRKTSVARVWLKPGNGEIAINHCDYTTYLKRPTSQMIVQQPLVLTDLQDTFQIVVNVKGGGLSGQAEAIRHGISRAIALALPEKRTLLKQAGLITRDARKKERKLPGQPGARKRFQFSKR